MLNGSELNLLFSELFGYSSTESGHRIGFIVDVPARASADSPEWMQRRRLVMKWARALEKTSFHACFVYAFENMGRNHVDLRHPLHFISLQDEVPDTLDELVSYRCEMFEAVEIFSRAEYWVVMTQFSLPGPVKVAAARYGFKAAVLSGFTPAMMPALSVNMTLLDDRAQRLANALTKSQLATLTFDVNGTEYSLFIDLRFRMGLATSGRISTQGGAASLPAGEAYIVPYENEKIGVISMTDGILPLEKDGQIALCEVAENRIVCIDGDNAFADSLRQCIASEPAMANLAEFGIGLLDAWGIAPIGVMHHDEKVAPHIALGRSEHLGGVTSPADFKNPAQASRAVFVFHPSLMPHIRIKCGTLSADDRDVIFMADGKYRFDELIDF